MTKDEVSAKMVAFYNLNSWAYFIITMGGGKTKGSLDCVISKWGYRRKGLIVCHSAKSRDKTWPDEIKQFHPELQEAIDRGFVRLIHRHEITNTLIDWYDWVIWDECHFMKPEHLMWVKVNYIQDLIIMTGTESSDEYIARNQRNMVKQAVLEISTEDGINKGLINDYRLKTIPVTMTDQEYADYLTIGGKLTIARSSGNQEWLQAVQGERMRYLYQCKSKLNIVKELDKVLSDKRRLLFMGSKEACDQVSPYVYYSGMKDTWFKAFASGHVDKLASVKQLRTGTNIKGFNQIICQQFNSKREDFMQTLGRLFRLEIGETGWLYGMYYTETQDQVWYAKASSQVPANKQRVYDLSKDTIQRIVADTF